MWSEAMVCYTCAVPVFLCRGWERPRNSWEQPVWGPDFNREPPEHIVGVLHSTIDRSYIHVLKKYYSYESELPVTVLWAVMLLLPTQLLNRKRRFWVAVGFQAGRKCFFSLPESPLILEPIGPVAIGGLFPGVKRSERETDHIHLMRTFRDVTLSLPSTIHISCWTFA